MARIRSTHPGQWTDEDFLECSPFARLLALALRNEADDQGVFEWKPVGLKTRLLPADNVDMTALLAELIEHRQICRYSCDGRDYGAIRNFMEYQRPKSPNSLYPITDEIRKYTGPKAGNSETSTASRRAVPEISADEREPIPRNGEIVPQVEGCKERREGKGREDSSLRSERARAEPDPLQAEFTEWYERYPHKVGKGAALKAYRGARRKASQAELLAGVRRYQATKPADRAWCNPATWLNQDRWEDQPAAEIGKPDGTGRYDAAPAMTAGGRYIAPGKWRDGMTVEEVRAELARREAAADEERREEAARERERMAAERAKRKAAGDDIGDIPPALDRRPARRAALAAAAVHEGDPTP